MLSSANFREIVSGRRTGLAISLLRTGLRLAEIPYTLAVRWRNHRYELGRAEIQSVAAPVISVGNLTLGGTGKTPFVKWLARRLTAQGWQPGIASRGYGSTGGGGNDEARELRQSPPHVPHVQNADRVAAARAAVEYHGCDVILLDDGFQHRRLARDFDIVLLDALEPFGFDHVFPRGTLREPVEGLKRAHVVCLSRADAISPPARASIRDRANRLAPSAIWCEVTHAPHGLINARYEAQSLELLRGRRLAAFCGIGNPTGFRYTLDGLGANVVAWREFPDHYSYQEADLAALAEWAATSRAEVAVCTRKDLVKIRQAALGDIPLWAIEIEIAFLAGEEELQTALDRRIGLPNPSRDGD